MMRCWHRTRSHGRMRCSPRIRRPGSASSSEPIAVQRSLRPPWPGSRISPPYTIRGIPFTMPAPLNLPASGWHPNLIRQPSGMWLLFRGSVFVVPPPCWHPYLGRQPSGMWAPVHRSAAFTAKCTWRVLRAHFGTDAGTATERLRVGDPSRTAGRVVRPVGQELLPLLLCQAPSSNLAGPCLPVRRIHVPDPSRPESDTTMTLWPSGMTDAATASLELGPGRRPEMTVPVVVFAPGFLSMSSSRSGALCRRLREQCKRLRARPLTHGRHVRKGCLRWRGRRQS